MKYICPWCGNSIEEDRGCGYEIINDKYELTHYKLKFCSGQHYDNWIYHLRKLDEAEEVE
jgi:hypothetical protein